MGKTLCQQDLIKRHGLIIQKAIEAAFIASPHFIVIESHDFKVSTAADKLTEFKPHELKSLPDLLYFPRIGRKIAPDLIILDLRTATAIAIEEKRAHGPSDAGKKSQIIRDLQCMRMNVRSFVEQKGYHVKAGDAKVIEYYGNSGLPTELTLNRDNLDTFFDTEITTFVEASTQYLRDKIEQLLPQKLKNLAA